MKNLLLLLLFIAFLPSFTNAQSLALTKTKSYNPFNKNEQANICYPKEHLSAISDTMFQQGNPKYIWVDLLKDGYIQDNDTNWHNIFITQNNPSPDKAFGNINLPDDIRKTYAEKWVRFIKYIKEPIAENETWMLSLHNGLNAKQVVNPESEFRKFTIHERHTMGFNAREDLVFYKELVKDGLISPDKALNLEFSHKGFFVDGNRISQEMRHKYMELCEELYGINYYDRYSRLSIGALKENTMQKRIAKLEQSIAVAENIAIEKN